MHHLIRFVVKADDEEDAMSKARDMLDQFTQYHTNSIDYGTFFDEEGSSVSGKGRWGDRKHIHKLFSAGGAELLLHGLQVDYKEMKEAIVEVRKSLEKSDQEIYEDGMARYYFRKVHEKQWVAHDGEFADVGLINYILTEIKDLNFDEWWIIPCDVHT